MNSENGAAGGSADNVSFIAFRPGHKLTLDLSADQVFNVNVQLMALPFDIESSLSAIYDQSLATHSGQVFADNFVVRVAVTPTEAKIYLSGVSFFETPHLTVPITDLPRTVSFAIDVEQNFIVNIGENEVLRHRVSDGLIVDPNDLIVATVSGYFDGQVVATPQTVNYSVGVQSVLEEHDYAVPPEDVYHFAQVETVSRDGDYFVAPSPFYVPEGTASNSSVIPAPMDGTVLRIHLPTVNLTGAASVFANPGTLRMNVNYIGFTNFLVIAGIGEGGFGGAVFDSANQGDMIESLTIVSATLETAVVGDIFKVQWYITDQAGLNYGFAFEGSVDELPPGFSWIWQIQSGNLLDAGNLTGVLTPIQVTNPPAYLAVEFSNGDGGGGGPDFSQDFIADGGTSSVLPTDLYWGHIENIQNFDPSGFEPWQFAKLVLNANPLHESPYSLSYAIAPNTPAGNVMYFVLPLNGQEGYITTGSGTDVAGFDPTTVAALIEIQVYLDGDQKMVQFSHIAGFYTSEPSVSFPVIDDDNYFEFQARINPVNDSVQLLLGAPGNATEFGPQMFANSGSLQRISLILATQGLSVIGRYGSSDAFLSDIAPIVIYNGDRVLESTDPISYRYDMLPAPIDHYDPNFQELVNSDLAFMHVIAPPVSLSLAQLALQGATGGIMGFYPEAPCTVRFILGRFPNVNDGFSLNVPQVRVGALEVIVPYGADGQINGMIFYRLVGSDGINYVFSQVVPHSPDEGYETGWTIGISFGSPTAPSTDAAGVVIFNRFDGTKLTLDSTRNIGTNNNFNDADGYVLPVENHPLFMSYSITPIGPAVNVPMRQVYIATGLPVEEL